MPEPKTCRCQQISSHTESPTQSKAVRSKLLRWTAWDRIQSKCSSHFHTYIWLASQCFTPTNILLMVCGSRALPLTESDVTKACRRVIYTPSLDGPILLQLGHLLPWWTNSVADGSFTPLPLMDQFCCRWVIYTPSLKSPILLQIPKQLAVGTHSGDKETRWFAT